MLLGYFCSITTDKGFTSVDKGSHFICQCAQIWLVAALESTVRRRVPASCMKSCTQFTSILDQDLLSCSPLSALSVGVAIRGLLRSFWIKGFLGCSSTIAWSLPLHIKVLLFTSPKLWIYPSPFAHRKFVSLGTLILYIYRAAFMDDTCGSFPVCGQSVPSCTWLSSSESKCRTDYSARSCTQ